MNSCRYPEVAKISALFKKLVAGEWATSKSSVQRCALGNSRMPSHFDAGRETAAAAYAVHPRLA
jgi:hypothetical protein